MWYIAHCTCTCPFDVWYKYCWWLTLHCYILYPLVQWNRWFANSDVPFQSVTNDLLHSQFAMQTYVLHQVDITSELLHSWWFAHAQSNNKTINVWLFVRVTLDLSALASGLVYKNRALGLWPRVLFLSTRLEARAYKSNVIHTEPYINYYLVDLTQCQ